VDAGDGVRVSVDAGDGVRVSVGAGDGVRVSVGAGDGVRVSVGAGDGVRVSVGAGDDVRVSVVVGVFDGAFDGGGAVSLADTSCTLLTISTGVPVGCSSVLILVRIKPDNPTAAINSTSTTAV